MTRHTSTSHDVWRVVTFVAVLCGTVAYGPALVHGQGGQGGSGPRRRRFRPTPTT